MNKILSDSENQLVEQTCIKHFKKLRGEGSFVNAYNTKGEKRLGRRNKSQVVLTKYLKPVMQKINNNDISDESIDQAIDILIEDRSQKDLVHANREVYKLLKNGAKVSIQNSKGETIEQTVYFIDWENPANNDFLLVSQMTILSDLYEKRPDLIGFVNGIPLVLIELKSPKVNVYKGLHDNIRDYKDTIPQIFWYNGFIMISNGLDNNTKIGTITSGQSHFSQWKKQKKSDSKTKVDLHTSIYGTCEKTRLLDLVENFTLFDDSKGGLVKIMAKYHQYFGVKKAIKQFDNRKQNDNKLGVFWHTQGSGKSFSMMFFTNKILRKKQGNYTFVIVTDRTQLDKQIYKGFLGTDIVKEKNSRADSIQNLKQLLQEDHRFIFTLIHKFQFDDNEKPHPINDRDDIIVITDESHRSQYGEYAMNMRVALPNAAFMGFTGTPLIKEEKEKTKEVFGDYVSVYNFKQSVDDGATVPIYYENRVPKLENKNEDIQDDLEKLLDSYSLDKELEEKLESEFSNLKTILKSEDRLESVSQDLVNHFMSRGHNGKAMVVNIDKETTVRTYLKVKEYFDKYKAKLEDKLDGFLLNTKREKIQKQIDFIDKLDMAVIISRGNNQNEIDDFRKIGIDFKPIRKRLINEDLETKFKKTDSNLRIAFVCDMWLTGFDAPSVSTLYLNKPMKNHSLMQTIARTNRVYKDKNNGLIVDYVGIFYNLRKALSIYASSDEEIGDDTVIEDKQELVNDLKQEIINARKLLQVNGLSLDDIVKESDGSQLLNIANKFVNQMLADQDSKKEFLTYAKNISKLYKAILPDDRAIDFKKPAKAIDFLSSLIVKKGVDSSNLDDVKKDIEELINKSIESEKFEIKERFNYKDLSKLPFDKLKDHFSKSKGEKRIILEKVMDSLDEKIDEMTKKNKIRKKFRDRLRDIIDDYNNSTKNIDKIFEELKDISDEVTKEDKRAVKENLTEEELAIFDLLYKEDINPDEEKQIKSIAKKLLQEIKEQLSLDWRKNENKRAKVEVSIRDFLYDELPDDYDGVCEDKVESIFQHIYQSYVQAGKSVY